MTPETRRRLLRLAPAAAYLAVVLLLVGDVLLSPSAVLSAPGEDLDGYYLGLRRFGFSELRAGNLPLWNPLLFGGAPYFANFETALLYPPNWLHLALPLERAINLGVALHLFLAGFLTFVWLRGRGASVLGSWLAGLFYMLSGPYFLHLYPGHLSNLCTLAWAPLLFRALDGWFDSADARWCLLGTAAVSLQILAGHPQYVYYTAVAAVLYCALRLRRDPRRAGLALGAAAMYAGAALVCAVQLLAGLESLAELSRGAVSPREFSRTFSLPPENLLTLLLPHAFGDIVRQPYYGRWHLWETCLFMGTSGLLLAAHGAAARDARRGRTDAAMVLLLLFLALGPLTPLYDVLYHYLPGYGLFRGTSKFSSLAALFMAASAAAGFDRLRAGPPPGRLAALAAGLGVAFTAAWVWLSLPADLGQLAAGKAVFRALEARGAETFFPPRLYHSVAAVRAAAGFAAGELLTRGRALLLVSALLYLAGSSRRWSRGLAALAVLEMLLFARGSKAALLPGTEYPRAWTEAAAALSPDERVLHIGISGSNPVFAAGVPDAWGYGPLYVDRYSKLMDFFWGLKPEKGVPFDPRRLLVQNPILRLLRVRHVFLYDPWNTILTLPPSPRVRLMEDWRPLSDPATILRTLADPRFDAGRTVLLERTPDPLPERSPRPGRAAVTRSSTDWLEIEAELERPAVLLVTDAYSRHWTVRSLRPDPPQERYEVLPADYALRAVPLRAGRHLLRMEYRPPGFAIGRWVSLAALAAFAVLCLVLRRRGPVVLSAPRPARGARKTAFVLLACLAAVEAAGLAAALSLGLWDRVAKRDPELGWIFPYRGGGNRWYESKADGAPQSGPRHDGGAPPELLFLGDSVARAGRIKEDGRTFAGILGGFNASSDGYSTYQERDLLVRDLASLRPERTVLVVCLNDVMTEAESREVARATLRENFHLAERTLLDYEPYLRIRRWLRARSGRVREPLSEPARRARDRAARIEGSPGAAVEADVWAEWTRALLDMKKAAGPGRFLIVLAPLRAHVSAYRGGQRDFWVSRELGRFAAAHDIPFLDLLPAFVASDLPAGQAFEDAFHLEPAGHLAAARAIRAFLESDRPARSRRERR